MNALHQLDRMLKRHPRPDSSRLAIKFQAAESLSLGGPWQYWLAPSLPLVQPRDWPTTGLEVLRNNYMTGLAERIETNAYAGLANNARYAPFASETEVTDEPAGRRVGLGGPGVIAALLVFSGFTVALARGQAGIAEEYGISQEALLGLAWVMQGALALVGFVLAVKWLRS